MKKLFLVSLTILNTLFISAAQVEQVSAATRANTRWNRYAVPPAGASPLLNRRQRRPVAPLQPSELIPPAERPESSHPDDEGCDCN